MKRSTLILVVLAALVGGFVYFREYRHPPARPKAETNKPAFDFEEGDVAALTITLSGSSVSLERQGGQWEITAPVRTRADQGAVGDIVDELVAAQISRTLAASPDRLRSFGLDRPAITVDIRLKNAKQHSVRLGNVDFSGQAVYAQLGGANDVVLLPAELRSRADQPLDQLRDRSVLGFSTWDVDAFELKDPSGDFLLAKQGNNWRIEKPRPLAADASAVSSLLSQVSAARMTMVASEAANEPGRYGLNSPALSFEVHLARGGRRALLLGKKSGDEYYARDTSRSMVFVVPASLYEKLAITLFDLRDKKILHQTPDQFSQIEVRNRNGRMVLAAEPNGAWKVAEPAALADKAADGWRILDPLTQASVKEILDAPPASVTALLARPAVEVELTDKKGKTVRIALSRPAGSSVYLRVGAGPAVDRVGKQTFDSLNFKLPDIVH
jgi:Domain of unknown function (DUF4340)